MSSVPFSRAVVAAVTVLVMAGAALFVMYPASVAHAGTTIELNNPLQQEDITPDVALTVEAIQNEAGISAWYNAGTPVNLGVIAPKFRTIEVQTANYIIGSVAIPDYPERYDVHVYVHKDGWFMAYYLKTNPSVKVFDIIEFDGATLKTTFEKVLVFLANEAAVPFLPLSFWHFQFPNANRFMLIAEDDIGGSDFTVNIPQSFAVYERTVSSLGTSSDCDASDVKLNGIVILEDDDHACFAVELREGSIAASQLPLGTTHTLEFYDVGALALVYRAQ